MEESPAIAVTRSSMPPFEEYCEEIQPIWESRWLTNMGAKHQQLEAALRDYLASPNVSLFVNGHAALECALEALDLKGKVITTPFTFASTTNAIVRKGLTPVFADIRPDDFTIDPAKVEALIDEDTCAILPVHVYGNLCDDAALRRIADKHGIPLIYDAAHAFGVKVDGASVAGLGDVSMFSFHATKAFNSIEGGALCFSDNSLVSKLDAWKNFGQTEDKDVVYPGGNGKMNEFCAAMGLCNLRHLDEEIRKRGQVANRYFENLHGADGIRLNIPPANVESNYAYMPILFEGGSAVRDGVMEVLSREGIGARKYFYPLTSQFSCYGGSQNLSSTPIAQWTSERIITLPLYAGLPLNEVNRICRIVYDALSY